MFTELYRFPIGIGRFVVDRQPLQMRGSVDGPVVGRLSEICLSDAVGDLSECNLQIIQESMKAAGCYPMPEARFKAEN